MQPLLQLHKGIVAVFGGNQQVVINADFAELVHQHSGFQPLLV